MDQHTTPNHHIAVLESCSGCGSKVSLSLKDMLYFECGGCITNKKFPVTIFPCPAYTKLNYDCFDAINFNALDACTGY